MIKIQILREPVSGDGVFLKHSGGAGQPLQERRGHAGAWTSTARARSGMWTPALGFRLSNDGMVLATPAPGQEATICRHVRGIQDPVEDRRKGPLSSSPRSAGGEHRSRGGHVAVRGGIGRPSTVS